MYPGELNYTWSNVTESKLMKIIVKPHFPPNCDCCSFIQCGWVSFGFSWWSSKLMTFIWVCEPVSVEVVQTDILELGQRCHTCTIPHVHTCCSTATMTPFSHSSPRQEQEQGSQRQESLQASAGERWEAGRIGFEWLSGGMDGCKAVEEQRGMQWWRENPGGSVEKWRVKWLGWKLENWRAI